MPQTSPAAAHPRGDDGSGLRPFRGGVVYQFVGDVLFDQFRAEDFTNLHHLSYVAWESHK